MLACALATAGVSRAAELCGNGGFESDLSGWGNYGGATLTRVAGGHSGGFALELKGSSTSSFGCNDVPDWVPSVSGVGGTYRFSAWVRSDASRGKVKVRVYEYAGTTQVGSTFYSAEIPLTAGWQQLVADYTIRQAGTFLSMKVTDAPVASGESFLVDDISILTPASGGTPPTPGNLSPVAALTVTPPNGDLALAVTADASGSTDTDGSIASYIFDFGDGTVVGPQPGSSAGHTYLVDGSFTATVTVSDNLGATAIASSGVVVTPSSLGLPNGGLCGNPWFESDLTGWEKYGSATLSRVTGGHSGGFALQIKGSTSSAFGCDDNPNWVSSVAGFAATYRFSAWVRAASGSGKVKISIFEYSGSTQVGSTFSSSSITLGSGWQEVVADYVVRKAGTTLSMRILDTPTSSGQTFLVDDVSIVMTAPPNLPPTAGLAVTPDNGTTPLVVSADASTSSDPEGKIASYKFDFGDGTSTVTVTAPTNKTSHTYSKAGNFTVKLTATDAIGQVSPAATANVVVTPPDNPPVGKLNVSGTSITTFSLKADASGSTDTDATPIASYAFDFGDGTVITTTAPTTTAQHTYTADGSYTIKLIVTDTGGKASAPASVTVTFTGPGSEGAGQIGVYVGYYDTHHPNNLQPKPNPWMGSPNVVFVGKPDGSSGGWDSSCLMIDNLTSSTLTNVLVTCDLGSSHYALWGTQSIPAGYKLILAQTSMENFDGSDTSPAGCIGCSPSDCLNKISHAIPVVHVSVGGLKTDYFDTGQILNTHGVDGAGCPYTGTRNDESSPWTLVFPGFGFNVALNSADDGWELTAASSEKHSLALAPPYPNPSRGDLGVKFRTPTRGPVRLGVYDISGRLLKTCVDAVLEPGEHLERVDLGGAPAGIYFCTMATPQGTLKGSFVLIR